MFAHAVAHSRGRARSIARESLRNCPLVGAKSLTRIQLAAVGRDARALSAKARRTVRPACDAGRRACATSSRSRPSPLVAQLLQFVGEIQRGQHRDAIERGHAVVAADLAHLASSNLAAAIRLSRSSGSQPTVYSRSSRRMLTGSLVLELTCAAPAISVARSSLRPARVPVRSWQAGSSVRSTNCSCCCAQAAVFLVEPACLRAQLVEAARQGLQFGDQLGAVHGRRWGAGRGGSRRRSRAAAVPCRRPPHRCMFTQGPPADGARSRSCSSCG